MEILYGLALSTHLFLEREYNEVHPTIQIEKDSYIAGAYLNSDMNLSFYSGRKFDFENGHAIEIGAVSGYNVSGSGFIPFTRYTYSNKEHEQVKYFIAPAPEKRNGKVDIGIVLGMEFLINKK